jgi:hypothetical protein
MSYPNLNRFPVLNYASPIQASKPVALCASSDQPPSVLPVLVNWQDFGVSYSISRVGVELNLSATSGQFMPPLDAVRSVKIDNSYCGVPVFLVFPDTGDTISCPPYSIIQTPVLTKALTCILYGDGFYTGRPPRTTVEFFNRPIEPLFTPGTLIGGIDMRYLVSGTSTSLGPVINFAASSAIVPPPAADRLIAFTFTGIGNSNLRSITSASCNGVALTAGRQASLTASPYMAAIFYGIIPTGTTLTVSATFSGQMSFASWCAIGISNYTLVAPVQLDSTGSATLNNGLVQLDVIPGAGAAYVGIGAGAPADGVMDWRGADMVQSLVPLGTALATSAVKNYDVSEGVVATFKPSNLIVGAVWN